MLLEEDVVSICGNHPLIVSSATAYAVLLSYGQFSLRGEKRSAFNESAVTLHVLCNSCCCSFPFCSGPLYFNLTFAAGGSGYLREEEHAPETAIALSWNLESKKFRFF